MVTPITLGISCTLIVLFLIARYFYFRRVRKIDEMDIQDFINETQKEVSNLNKSLDSNLTMNQIPFDDYVQKHDLTPEEAELLKNEMKRI